MVNRIYLRGFEIKKLFLVGLALFLLFGCTEQKQFLLVDADQNLNDLNDVEISSPTNAQALIYQSSSGLWKNLAQAGSGGGHTYSGISPITVDNDNNLVGLNVKSTDDWNGTFDGQQGTYYLNWANDNNRLFSLLSLDSNASFDARYQSNDATLTSLAGISGVQGDLIYASGTDSWTNLAKNTTATRYLSNTGATNNPAWAQITLTNGVTGTLPVLNGGTGVTGSTGSIAVVLSQQPTLNSPIINTPDIQGGTIKDFSSGNIVLSYNSTNVNVWVDLNVRTGKIRVGNSVYDVNLDLNKNAISIGCTSIQFMGGDGLCHTAGGDVNNTDISPNFIQVDTNAIIDGNLIVKQASRIDGNANYGSDIILNQGKRFCFDPNCIHYSLFDGSKRIDT